MLQFSLFRPCLAAVFLSWLAHGSPIVHDEKSGVTYQGTVSGSVEHFQNIRYAHDTSGKRRFAPPEPFRPPPDTIVDATSPGPGCPQMKDAMPPFFSDIQDISEDCLNLRIARPAGLNLSSESKLPVVVWIHGGGVVKGSAYDPHFDPDNLIKLSAADGSPVIYAALNYRLTIFGFARLPVLKSQKSLNVGMRDQREGLQWIKDNIEAFGGDPERITAFGLSAGGTFLSLHQMAYGGKKGVPFQQAWMMSGPPGTALNMTSDATTQHTTAVAERLECGHLTDSKMLDCLRDVPMQRLLDTAMAYSVANHPPAGLFTFIPSVDDDLFPDRQSTLFRAGNFVKGIRMVYGWTQDDGAINAGIGNLINSEEDMIGPIKAFFHWLSVEQLQKLFSLYDPRDFEADVSNYEAHKRPEDPTISVHYYRLSRIMRDLLFTCSSIEFGYQMVKHTQASLDANFSGVRLYDLNQSVLTPLWEVSGMPYVGVSHGSDTNYIFNGVFPEGQMGKDDQDLSQEFTRSFINFAYYGDPNDRTKSETSSSEWLDAYGDVSGDDSNTMPSTVNIQVIGGPYGTGPVSLSDEAERKSSNGDSTVTGDAGNFDPGNMQHVMADPLKFGSMDSAASHARQGQIQREKLFQRCAYVSSLAETLGV